MTGMHDRPSLDQSEPGTPGAVVIRFPARAPAPPAIDRDAEAEAQARLRRALAALDAALAEQREAVASWRNAIGGLQASMTNLGSSVQTYRARLDSLAVQVAGVHHQAAWLEEWADQVLGSQPGPT